MTFLCHTFKSPFLNPHIQQRLWRLGNPTQCALALHALKRSNQEGSNYVPNGDPSLTPEKMMMLRSYFMSRNTLWGLMIYTMNLIGTKLFQRADEIISLQYSSLEIGLSVMNNEGNIIGIAVIFQGKCDKVPVTLILWVSADDLIFFIVYDY